MRFSINFACMFRQPYGSTNFRRSAGGGFTNFSSYGSYASR